MTTEDRVRCSERVFTSGAWTAHPCSRWAVRDGFCKQHHPDAVKARREAQELKWKLERETRDRRAAIVKTAGIDSLCKRIEKFADYDERGNRVLVDAIILEIMENGR